jgi:hypothetical protein
MDEGPRDVRPPPAEAFGFLLPLGPSGAPSDVAPVAARIRTAGGPARLAALESTFAAQGSRRRRFRLRPPPEVRLRALRPFVAPRATDPRRLRLAAPPTGHRSEPRGSVRCGGSCRPCDLAASRPADLPRRPRPQSVGLSATLPGPAPRPATSPPRFGAGRSSGLSASVTRTARSDAEDTGGAGRRQAHVPAGQVSYTQVTASGERVTKGCPSDGREERAQRPGVERTSSSTSR